MPDINRALSLLIEPMPKHTLAFGTIGGKSDKQAWMWVYSNNGVGFWKERAWDTDETANAQIFDMMPEPILQYDAATKRWGCKAQRDFRTDTYEWDAERKKAVRAACYEWLTQRQGVK